MEPKPETTPRTGPNIPPAPPGAAGMTPAQILEIKKANELAKKIRKAASVAKTDGTITAIFAAFGFLFFCGGWENPVMGVLLGAIAYNSFRGAKKLGSFDRAAPGLLAKNQMYVAAVIVAYALEQLWMIRHGHSGLIGAIAGNGSSDKDMSDLLGSDGMNTERQIRGLIVGGLYAAYIALVPLTILFQGLLARYYKARAKDVDAYLTQTPQWVIDFQAAQH